VRYQQVIEIHERLETVLQLIRTGLVTISDVRWIRTVAIEVTNKYPGAGKVTSVISDLGKLLAQAKEPV
jgi:hypothetical protein